MPAQKILIVGAGIAGSVTAYWLGKHDYEVVVIERSKSEQKAGQGLEIEEPAIQVVRAMGIVDRLEARKTIEGGFRLVGEDGKSRGSLTAGGVSPTGSLELMRGDLAEVLYRAADESPNVTYRFETTLRELSQSEDSVTVTLEDRQKSTTTSETFDMVIGADGVKSRTRNLVFGSPETLNCFKPVGSFNAYFSIPKEPQDWPYSRLCHFPGRRIMWIRPTGKDSDFTSVYLIHISDNVPALRAANAAGDRQAQKEALAELFADCGWEAPRVTKQMLHSDNFYSDELVQVKLETWSQHRVVLLGDSAWAPTPFTGQGNQLAIIGGWVLAQELVKDRSPAAFGKYEKRLRAYVEESQQIPMGGWAPKVFCPDSRLGIWAFRTVFRVVTWVIKALSWLPSLSPERPQAGFELDMKDGNRMI